MQTPLGYRILDGFGIMRDGAWLTPKGAKARGILAWFCLTGQPQISRARLADLFWSGSNEEKARASLRNLLYALREEVQPPLLIADHATVSAAFATPVHEIAAAIAAWDAGDARPLAALSLAEAELRFGADLFGLDAEFDDVLRQCQARILTEAADALRRRLEGGGEHGRVVAEKLRELVPQDETATRHLMRLEIAAGNSAAALAHYNRLWQVLDEEFDVEPAEATQLLAIQVKSQAAGPPPVAPAAAIAGPVPAERIAIYLRPTAAAGLPEETQMMIGGMQAEILAALLSYEEWVVIETEAETALPSRRGCYELRSVFSPGLGAVRLILSLKDLASGQVIWSRPLAVNRSDWMRNSAIAVQRLAVHLTGRVEFHYLDQIGDLADEQLPDYDKLVRARWLMNDWTPEADRRAEELMRSVTGGGELGLRARIGLAELLNSRGLVFPGLAPPRAGVAEALALAESCVSAGAERADLWLVLAWAALQSGRIGRAAEAAEAALTGSQSSPRRIASAAVVLALAGDVAQGAELSRLVGQMDTGLSRITLGHRVAIALAEGDLEGCIDLATRADGAIVLGFGYAAAAAAMAGDEARAAKLWQRFGAGLAARWHGPAPPRPLDWFLSATPVQDAALLDRLSRHLAPVDCVRVA